MKTIHFFTRLLAHREKLLISLVEWTKPWYGRFFQKSKIPWQVNLEKLKRFPPKSLGSDLGLFLEKVHKEC